MTLAIDALLRQLASYLHTPIQVDREIFTLNVPLDLRHQEVAVTVRQDDERRAVIELIATVGPIDGLVDPWRLLATNAQTTFCRVAADRGVIFVAAAQLLETAQPQEVLLLVREVATTADRLEQLLFAKDEI